MYTNLNYAPEELRAKYAADSNKCAMEAAQAFPTPNMSPQVNVAVIEGKQGSHTFHDEINKAEQARLTRLQADAVENAEKARRTYAANCMTAAGWSRQRIPQ